MYYARCEPNGGFTISTKFQVYGRAFHDMDSAISWVKAQEKHIPRVGDVVHCDHNATPMLITHVDKHEGKIFGVAIDPVRKREGELNLCQVGVFHNTGALTPGQEKTLEYLRHVQTLWTTMHTPEVAAALKAILPPRLPR